MKYIKLIYPNKTHNIIVTNFGYKEDLNKYFMEYYDLNEGAKQYTVLNKVESNYEIVDNNININDLLSNYKKLDTKDLPETITCNKVNEKQTVIVEVYIKDNNYFLATSICSKINIHPVTTKEKINGIECYKLNEQELNQVKNYENEKQKVVIKNIFMNHQETKTKQMTQFIVYVDKNNNNQLFVSKDICEKYNLTNKKTKVIENIECKRLTEEEIRSIEQSSKQTPTTLIAFYKYVHLEKELENNEELEPNNKKMNKKVFLYYIDQSNNKRFITRGFLDIARNLGINIEGIPKIIDNKNCYSITESELQELENKANLKGIEKKIIVEEKKEVKEINSDDIVIAYIDKTNNKIYIPVKEKNTDTKTITITGKECVEITEIELENLKANKDIKVVTVSVYLKKPEEKKEIIVNNKIQENKKLEIILCKINNSIFIKEDIAIKFKLKTDTKKIKVDGLFYIETSETNLAVLKNEASKLLIDVIFKVKNIKPVIKNNEITKPSKKR